MHAGWRRGYVRQRTETAAVTPYVRSVAALLLRIRQRQAVIANQSKGNPMKNSIMFSAVLMALALSACNKPTVVTPPPSVVAVPVPTGVPGPAGPTGATGATGAAAEKGDTGATGATGAPGKSGGSTVVIVPGSTPEK
jgi:Collagen triple helix repeat (20 copies)